MIQNTKRQREKSPLQIVISNQAFKFTLTEGDFVLIWKKKKQDCSFNAPFHPWIIF